MDGICSIGRALAETGSNSGEQAAKPATKAADMRPARRPLGTHRRPIGDRFPIPKMMLTPNQTARKAEATRVLRSESQSADQRRHFRRPPPQSPRRNERKTALHKGKAQRGCHGAGYRGGRADHRRDGMLVGEKMRQRARPAAVTAMKMKKPDRAKSAAPGALPNGQQATATVETDMAEDWRANSE